jgi:hypothetical protein
VKSWSVKLSLHTAWIIYGWSTKEFPHFVSIRNPPQLTTTEDNVVLVVIFDLLMGRQKCLHRLSKLSKWKEETIEGVILYINLRTFRSNGLWFLKRRLFWQHAECMLKSSGHREAICSDQVTGRPYAVITLHFRISPAKPIIGVILYINLRTFRSNDLWFLKRRLFIFQPM